MRDTQKARRNRPEIVNQTPDAKIGWLWGRVHNTWHAITVHHPDFEEETKVSEKLTAVARQRDVEAKPVTYRLVVRAHPGTGNTACGLVGKPLHEIGVDPEKGDKLCESCVEASERISRETKPPALQV